MLKLDKLIKKKSNKTRLWLICVGQPLSLDNTNANWPRIFVMDKSDRSSMFRDS